jgi:hypothetical protein
MTVHQGQYLVWDFKDYTGRKNIGAVKVDERVTAWPSHVESGTRYTGLTGLASGKGRRYTEKVPNRISIRVASALLKPNYLRVPDDEAQVKLRDYDSQVERLEGAIAYIRRAKQAYIEEHRLEWDIPKWEDFSGLKGWQP